MNKDYKKVKKMLKSKGWKEQKSGEIHINGTFGTNFEKDGEVIHLNLETMPDEEFIEQEF